MWNWCNVVQYLLLVLAGLPLLLGAPDWIDQTAGLVALGWALWLEWFAARVAAGRVGIGRGRAWWRWTWRSAFCWPA